MGRPLAAPPFLALGTDTSRRAADGRQLSQHPSCLGGVDAAARLGAAGRGHPAAATGARSPAGLGRATPTPLAARTKLMTLRQGLLRRTSLRPIDKYCVR